MKDRRRSESRQRTELVVFRVLPGELATLKQAAKDQGVSLSEFARERALRGLQAVSSRPLTGREELWNGSKTQPREAGRSD